MAEGHVLECALTDKNLVEISDIIGNGWEFLALYLNITQAQIDKIKEDNRQMQQQIYNMLQKWKNTEGCNATLTSLLIIMTTVPGCTIDWNALRGIYGPVVNNVLRKKINDNQQTSLQVPKDSQFEHSPVWQSANVSQEPLAVCRADIIRKYRDETHLPLSPYVHQHTAALTEMYVKPPMFSMEYEDLQKDNDKIRIKSYREIFYKCSERCRNIFITSPPGAGKTTLCKWMKLMWCQAHEPLEEYNGHFADEDLALMKEFDFFCLVPLRNFTNTDRHCIGDSHCIDEMILQEIAMLTNAKLEEILSVYSCLIVLDGLDEYAPLTMNNFKSRILELRSRKATCIVITTRPWKFYDLQLQDHQVDQLIEISKFEDLELDTLIDNVISSLNKKSKQNKSVTEFRTVLCKCTKQDIVRIPIILMQLACLWYDNKPLGHSQCEMYANMLELFFHRALGRFDKEQKSTKFQIPNCFTQETPYCRYYMKLLQELGHLAFDALFYTHQKLSLVFDASLVNEYLSDKEIELCLRIGILSQTKRTHLTLTESKFEFFHKTFQEFLAALYIFMRKKHKQFKFWKKDERLTLIQEVTTSPDMSIDKILESSEILIFLSGLCSSVVSKVFKNISQIISSSEGTWEHRHSLKNHIFPLSDKTLLLENHILKQLQDLFMNCLSESIGINSEIPNIHIQDVFYCVDNVDDHYLKSLQYLIDHSTDSIRSLCVNSLRSALQKIIVKNLKHLDCLYVMLHDIYKEDLPEEMTTVLKMSVPILKQVGLRGVILTKSFVDVLQNCRYLQSLELWNVELTHIQIEELMLFLSQKTDLREISLASLCCTEHLVDYNELKTTRITYNFHQCLHKLDLTKHRLLVYLHLSYTFFSSFGVNKDKLRYCKLGSLCQTEVSAILGEPSHLPNLTHLRCRYLWSSDIIDLIFTTITSLVNLVTIEFYAMDIRDKKFVLAANMKLERISLHTVLLTISTLQELVHSLLLVKHKIDVAVLNCDIWSTEDAKKFKQEIRSCRRRYTVYSDTTKRFGFCTNIN